MKDKEGGRRITCRVVNVFTRERSSRFISKRQGAVTGSAEEEQTCSHCWPVDKRQLEDDAAGVGMACVCHEPQGGERHHLQASLLQSFNHTSEILSVMTFAARRAKGHVKWPLNRWRSASLNVFYGTRCKFRTKKQSISNHLKLIRFDSLIVHFTQPEITWHTGFNT